MSSAGPSATAQQERGSRPLRVLTVVDRAVDCGGAERFAVGLAQHLPRERFEPWLCTTRAGEDGFAREIADSGIPHVMLDRRSKWDVHRLAGLATLLRRERFDILHAHKFGSNLWCSMIGRACGVPVVLAHEHTWSYSGDPLRMWLDGHLIGRLATRFIAVSPRDAERMITLEHVPAEKVLFIPTAYIPRRDAVISDIRAEFGLQRDTPVIAIAAVLRRQKAISVLLEAHARILRMGLDAHLMIAGDGECLDTLQARVRELGSTEHVHFLGRRDDVEAIVAAADVAALSSDYEGLPLFVFECMANGTPLVATDVGGLGAVVQDGVNGLLVPPRDPQALAEALAAVLRSPSLRAELARAARLTAADYTIEAIAERFAELYESLAAVSRV